MKNLQVLSKDALINLIMELDDYINYELQKTNSYEVEALKNQLFAQYRKYDEMNQTREYWKNKYIELARETGVLKSRKVSKPETVKKDIEPEIIKKEYKDEIKVYVPKTTYSHTVESTKGNITKSKHSGHKTKDEVLVGIFPKGEVKEFDAVEDAKTYIRKNYLEFKQSPLTNISRAARLSGFYKNNGGMAYNVKWSYKPKETETVDGVRIESEEN